MNGRRRFLLGTVLSIQNTCFTYPACQICFSRLTHSSNWYQCQKCNQTFQDAPQRYRLCMKVAEDQMLHIITVFGSCLERIFGSSASSLHRQLQESDKSLCDGGEDKAQQLLFQAAEDCLIGRSFIFAVKVPDHLHRGGSVVLPHLVACQIIPINNDPSVSILNRYHRLAEFILSNSSINTRHEPFAHSAHKGFWDLAESSHSPHHSENQFADYWQQSLGLVSSPTLNTTTELLSCSPSQSEVPKAKAQSCEEEHIFQEYNLLAQSDVKPEGLKGIIKDDLCIPKNSPLKSKNSSETVVKLQADTCGYNQSSSRADPLSSRVSCRHHRHLQNVCNSSSYGCQDCSVCRKHFPSQNTQTAESHQVESRTWDEFPFSESLGEFIARLENSEEEKFLQEKKLCVRSNEEEDCEGPSTSVHDFCKTPGGLPVWSSHKTKNNTRAISPHSFRGPFSEMVASKGPSKIIQSSGFEDCVFEDYVLTSSASESLQELSQENFLPDDMSKDSVSVDHSLYPTASSHHETFKRVNKNAPSDGERSLQISTFSHIAKNSQRYIPSVGHYDSTHLKETGDVDNERRSEDEALDLLRSEILVSPGDYNASADLFDTGEELLGETLQSKHKISLKRRQSMNVRSSKTSLWGSPCTDIILRRHSHVQAGFLQEDHETGVIHDLFSCLQSTPMLRPLSNSSFITGNSSQVSVSDPRAPVISRRLSNPLSNFLLKKIGQSLSRSQSNMFCTVSDNYRLYSPVSTSFSEMSRRQVLQRRRTLAIKSGNKKLISEDKENCNVLKCNGRSNEEGGDSCAMTKHEMDGVEDGETASPMNSSLHMATVLEPCDWSPELFSENSNMSKQNDTIQRRLF